MCHVAMLRCSYRFGIGRFTTVEEVDYTVNKCVEQVNHLRSMRLLAHHHSVLLPATVVVVVV